MAYCRFDGTSDVYLYASVSGNYVFHILGELEDVVVKTPKQALSKLRELRQRGLRIPDSAFERLEQEL